MIERDEYSMKKKKSIFVTLILILIVSIGYALLSTNLRINGLLGFSKSNWDVHFENVVVNDNSIETNLPVIGEDKTSVTFGGNFSVPGEFYEFSIDVVNSGTIDAMIDEIIIDNLVDDYKDYVNYNITYDNESEINKYNVLFADSKRTIKVRVEYEYDIDVLPEIGEFNNTFSLNYIKADKELINYDGLFWNFDYAGEEQVFNVLYDGIYILETWGAQGGTINFTPSGLGGYSVGKIKLKSNEKLYINVGGQGENASYERSVSGGYNGGGVGALGRVNGSSHYLGGAGGGGATHIATTSGLLYTLESKNENILLVSGGGGGFGSFGSDGNAGGMNGNSGYSRNKTYSILGGTQTSGFAFGKGQDAVTPLYENSFGCEGSGGGGGGFYGGFAQTTSGYSSTSNGGGGSGYIGNSLLFDKVMYCYNCEESDEVDTKTISTTNASGIPRSNYVKAGNGYARITYLGK